MQEISPTNIISILKQQNKNKDKKGKKIHCLQHIEYLKNLIRKEEINKKTRKISHAMQSHMRNSHIGIKNVNISDINNNFKRNNNS